MAAIAIAISSILPGNCPAQYGYPGGYGGYGWGGWGSTIQGSTAAGLGYFNMGRGAYNEQTAVARSINNDTYLRWNQYMYQSQQHANNLYHQRLRAEHMRVDKARAAIQDRLRNHPEERDITDGDALERSGRRAAEPVGRGRRWGRSRRRSRPSSSSRFRFELLPKA